MSLATDAIDRAKHMPAEVVEDNPCHIYMTKGLYPFAALCGWLLCIEGGETERGNPPTANGEAFMARRLKAYYDSLGDFLASEYVCADCQVALAGRLGYDGVPAMDDAHLPEEVTVHD